MKNNNTFFGFLCGDGWEEALCQELADQDPENQFSSPTPGLVLAEHFSQALLFEPVFARQWLPNCVEVRGTSIADLVQVLGKTVDGFLDQRPLPWPFY